MNELKVQTDRIAAQERAHLERMESLLAENQKREEELVIEIKRLDDDYKKHLDNLT